jgi:ankyrin repeat protein
LNICQILLKRGASPNGNTIYEMRPLHIAIRRQWTQVSRLLLEAGRLKKSCAHLGANPNIPEKDMYASRPMDIAVLNEDTEMIEVPLDFLFLLLNINDFGI